MLAILLKSKQPLWKGNQYAKNHSHIVSKYDGMIDYYEENGVFYVDILLKHTKQERKTTKHEKSIDI